MFKLCFSHKSQTKRTKEYKKNAVLLLIFQCLSLVTSLFLIPVVIHALGKEEYGIWVVLVTIVGWLGFFDLGLGHGLRNKYAEAKALGQTEEIKRYVSTAFIIMCGISLSIFILFFVISPFISWTTVFACRETLAQQLNPLIWIVMGTFCLRFVCNICTCLLLADQKPAFSNLINLSGQVLSLIVVTLMVSFFKPNLLSLGTALSVSQVVPCLLAFFILFAFPYRNFRPRVRYFSKSHIHSIFSLGIRFFAIQLTALILFQTNNFIIAHVCSLEDVAEFNIAYKYMGILQIAFTAILTPLWSASTDAVARGDTSWIKTAIVKINFLWVLTILAGFLMVLVSPWVYRLWLRDTISSDRLLLSLCLVYFICLIRSNIYRSFMNGAGKIKLQFLVTLVQSMLHVPFAILFGKSFGMIGVLTCMILWQAVNCIWEPRQYRLILAGTARGIWNE